MTALAMIIGMVPMALGLGEGGEQNAPLGRAVIGGLVLATVATLFFVPAVFALLHGRNGRRRDGARVTGSECRTVRSSGPIVGGVLLLAVGAGARVLGHLHARASALDVVTKETRELARADRGVVITPERGAPQQEIVLPGTMQAFTDAPIYARTNGYLQQAVRRHRRPRDAPASCWPTSTRRRSISSSSRRAPIWRPPKPTRGWRRRPPSGIAT